MASNLSPPLLILLISLTVSLVSLSARGLPLPRGSATSCSLGIPFAKPPVGELRFRPPVPLSAHEQVLPPLVADPALCASAKNYKPACMQEPGSLYPVMSEDCLYLNVYAPTSPPAGKLRPVMVWIYGGSYTSGAASLELYNGQPIASQQGDIVVVSMNYRIGALGFLGLDALQKESNSTGNYGLLDQIEALKWVQKNIARYGGDPDQVTIFGESAGGAAVCALMSSPLSKGLFHKAIMESGLCQDVQSFESAVTIGGSFMEHMGCDLADLMCIRAANPKDIVFYQSIRYPQTVTTPWAPTIDKHVLNGIPLLLLEQGSSDVHELDSVIIGTNSNETAVFFLAADASRQLTESQLKLLLSLSFNTSVADLIVDTYLPTSFNPPGNTLEVSLPALTYVRALTDKLFTCPSKRAAQAISKLGIKTFSYVFGFTPRCSYYEAAILPLLGAFHGSELPYVFDTRPSPNCTRSQEGLDLSHRMVDYWTSFARGDTPFSSLAGSIDWIPVSSTHAATYLAERDSLVMNFRSEFCELWDSLPVNP
eukprot:TRINITY_DN2130_c0_g1_i1.p1 TRINITY_DN2130_c0_g1~~TRINITY_DN2130_c0_g1_i1.p1  ORF type:complete len:545 (+),score=86.68 TRINITY_DN2130_c0_g1_i1:23-1636(+)